MYDGHNRRVIENDSKGTSYSFYSHDGQLLLRETPQGTINYLFLGKKLIAKHKDFAEAEHPTANLRMHYRPFGASLGSASNVIGYTGHMFGNF